MKRVFAFIGFTVAITLIVLNIIQFNYSYIVLIGAAALFAASLFFKSFRQGKVVPLVTGSVIFACILFITAYNGSYIPQNQLDGQYAEVTMRLISQPEETASGGYQYTAEVSSVKAENAPQNFKIRLYSDAELAVECYTDFDAAVQFYSVADNAFESYGAFGDNIFLNCTVRNIYEIYEQDKALGYYFLTIRDGIGKILEMAFDGDALALASGILLGDKTLISDELLKGFEVCGISHIIAVSGLHISVICLCLYQLLKIFDCSRLVRTIVSIATLFVYSGVSGFPKSVVRAGIMVSILLLSKLFSAKADTLNSLGVAVFVICMNPFAVSDASVLLTVTALIGMVVVMPKFKEMFKVKFVVTKYIRDSVCVSISVLLTTMPVMWLVFGKISFVAILANIVIIPCVQAALIFTALYVMFSGIPFLLIIPKALAELFLNIIVFFTRLLNRNFFFLFRDIENDIFGIAIFAIMLFCGISLIFFKKIHTKITISFICVIFAFAGIINMYEQKNNVYVAVTGNSMVVAYDDKNCVVVGMNSKSDYYDYFSYSRQNNYFINCKYDGYGEENNYEGKEFISEDLSVKESNDEIILTVCNKDFEIKSDCVIISNKVFYKDTENKFDSNNEIIFVLSKEG